ncbi:probable beta-1,4-xylosyltransferase IRX9H [Eucalyptus grandis]|uniref:Glycosyltransferases n=4 Tax=Eucalyptus grandis TaxID=71139 RepID=A0A059BRJ2_EUCGR|nr:probable beta-1,4-xylosyltransferase IRX9H [Eucalyptus grandis]XP_018732258.1 probable beta-1,4-xylosyltransferase IRX9H [Eucalyptus grandis]XP_039171860.1 probable beta-1,4-xylosyltransferase IRX9H [Eucalyptus grandis]KAK3425681.1 hypothetical protein EUGRSUZ_F02177 [Eucalyptus grandis]KAK3425682.1 hypothetical protein EUGRSUZ_F02177 [Eucalyptus grandis]KAK3425683.1 hypothetical protein EUGRSUZ_F02177 [Eucalyptus grandis]
MSMVSSRRTLPPYNDRNYPNGDSFLLGSSPNQRPSYVFGKASSASLGFAASGIRIRGMFAAIFPGKYSRKSPPLWRSFYRFLLFFILGFLLGLIPYGHVNDLRANHSLEVKPPPTNVRLDAGVDQSIERKDFVIRAVNLRVEEKVEMNLEEGSSLVPKKQLIVVTPTYNRALQAYFLNRLGQVLRLVQSPLLWIVVEMDAASMETADVLRKTGVMYRHLVCVKNVTDVKDQGVHQRNKALEHIQHHQLDGIVYFADDYNIYSIELFKNLRQISRFGTWPVAMLAQSKNKVILEGPVCNGSQIMGWHTNERSKRLHRFQVDKSGFAFNSTILWDPKRWHHPISNPIQLVGSLKEGFQGTKFIEQVVEDESQMEAIPPGCSLIMNWHLYLDGPGLPYPPGWLLQKNLDDVLPLR